MLETEFNAWKTNWRHNEEDPPNKLIDALKSCSFLQFPNLYTLLKIFLTLPVTSCESERSFSQLDLLKTARRSTMYSNKLNSLALMKTNCDHCNSLTTPMKLKHLVNTFARFHPRRMMLSFTMGDN